MQFFFQAEVGIRDLTVTGVQTCALPIAARRRAARTRPVGDGRAGWSASRAALAHPGSTSGARTVPPVRASRAAHRRGAAARRPWGARDDRHLRRPRGGCRAPRRGVGRPGRDRARAGPLFSRRRSPPRRRERRGVRAARRTAVSLPRAPRADVPAGDGRAAHADRALCAWVGGPRHRLRPVDRAARGLQSFPRTMIRTLWVYAVLVASIVIHASGVLVAALLGVKRRPGGIYDWGASDWARDIIAAAGTAGEAEGSRRHPPAPHPLYRPHPSPPLP